jgi:anaerobic ribonucleoside-triphosphate reductase activating protein
MHDDMKNGAGLRMVLFVSGCNHDCKGCCAPQTHDPDYGRKFDNDTLEEIYEYLGRDYTSGITFSGGEPLYESNLEEIYNLIVDIKEKFPTKNIWLYTGYTFEDAMQDKDRAKILELCDVVVDGEYIEDLKDDSSWGGSANQRIIDVKETLDEGNIVLYT